MQKKNIISIDTDDDDDNYNSFDEFLNETTKQNKNKIANDIELLGNDMLIEIERKRVKQEIEKNKYIKYILKHTKAMYTESILRSYSYGDVKQILLEVKANKKSFLKKFFKFLDII